ncbi:protein dopey-1-like isoform X2 [Ornithodoros turicata]|uniref:protein dopey-1-like isoform X2 n=1 Tax=Ornithodoros turicata TaxID=34597 RepID=UPI003139644D
MTTMEEYELYGDAKYRSYVTAVDKALKYFECTSEWADLISALGKLNKVLQSHQRFQLIPRHITVSKRLAQCMHPALPSGVHLRALETYELIFRNVGPQRLANDLYLYSAGLFPLLAYAAMNVRPTLLALYENHLLPLGVQLRPGLNGFLAGVLPGLEEGSDYYQRTDTLLLNVCIAVEKRYFYGCLWKCVLCNPGIRLQAITFVVSHYNRKLSMEDQLYIIGTDIDCMVQALCAALQDTSVLVQRSALELLLLGFPLHNCQLVFEDRARICSAAVIVLLRRDMSLNRRLFAWLFGSDGSTTASGIPSSETASPSSEPGSPTGVSTSAYFYAHASSLLLEALRNVFSQKPNELQTAPVLSGSFSIFWPYRILISLMDRQEITTVILDDILIDVFRSLYHECNQGSLARSQQEKQNDRPHFELVKTANLLFSSLEPTYLWGYVAKGFREACKHPDRTLSQGLVAQVGSGTPSLPELCILSEFLLDVISLETYVETPTEHLPDLLHNISQELVDHCGSLAPVELEHALSLCSRLLYKVQPSIATTIEDPLVVNQQSQIGSDDASSVILRCMHSFQQLLVRFVSLWLLSEPAQTVVQFDSVLVKKRMTAFVREDELRRLLESVAAKEPSDPYRSIDLPKVSRKMVKVGEVKLELLHGFQRMQTAYASLCRMLVELSSFPVLLATSRKLFDKQTGTESSELPEWLRYLLILACFCPDHDILLASMGTVLHLLGLSQTATLVLEPERKTGENHNPANSVGSGAMVSLPMVRPLELQAVLEGTHFVGAAARCLWNLLGEHAGEVHLRAAELLQQLHSLAGNEGCEDVLCNTLASEDDQERTEAQKRFSILWHLSRDHKFQSSSSSPIRSFDRCLFQMLDCLNKETGAHRATSLIWLNHALMRGDLARLLEPAMLVLFHPDTARVSIQHVSIQQPQVSTPEATTPVCEDLPSDTKIFAISSVGGNVIYHVDKSKKTIGSSLEKKVLALTSMVGPEKGNGSKFVTRSSTIQDIEFPPASLDLLQPMSLVVNPFGSLLSLDMPDVYSCDPPDFSNITRADGTGLRKDSPIELTEVVTQNGEEQSPRDIVRAILDEIVDAASSSGNKVEVGVDALSHNAVPKQGENSLMAHPLHTHILLYSQVFDSHKTHYALNAIKSIIESNPRATLCSMATTSVGGSLSQRGALLLTLLARHRKSMFGNGFHGDLAPDALSGYRSSMYLEALVTACLYFIRSYYPNLPQSRLTATELAGSRSVRLLCCEVLRLVFSELVAVVRDSGRSFAVYLGDLLARCKVQKALLHCVVASVHGFQEKKMAEDDEAAFTTDVVEFNEKSPGGTSGVLGDDFQETFQVHLLQLLSSLIVFEDRVSVQTGDEGNAALRTTNDKMSRFQPQMSTLRYQHNVSLPCQAMFGTAMLTALRQRHKAHMHTHWLSLVMCSLPYSGKCLTQIVLSVASQICTNLEYVVRTVAERNTDAEGCPPDYLISLVEGLTLLCHYCVLDASVPAVTPLTQQPPPTPSLASGANASQIISNLIHVFSNTDPQKDAMNREGGSMDPILTTRRSLLSNLPRLLAALACVWEATSRAEREPPHKNQSLWIMGAPKVVKQHILGFLSPISINYGSNFMAAVAVVWYERRKKCSTPQRKVIPQWSADQLLLVELVSAIKVLPMDSVVQLVRQVIRQPPPTSNDKKKRVPLEVSMLQFFLAYMTNMPGTQLLESWSSLLGLWKDGLQLTSMPLVQFHLLGLLNEFVQKAPLLEDKKDQKDLQDIAQKVIDACSTVASASLEQTTWLRRNLAVRPGPQPDVLGSLDGDADDPGTTTEAKPMVEVQLPESVPVTNSSSSHAQYSVQALCVLSEFLAPVLDVVYVSEEKEKVVPLLTSIMFYVTPYLKNRTAHNIPSFRACSQLVASLSSYQYTRKAWKRDALELLLDSAFFQMDHQCLRHWQSIIDHLMTHDKTTFRDFLARFSLTQSGSLSIFSSKEQEYESRSSLLKRLAFILFCSEADQYQRYMPDIQQRLSESLRLNHVPAVQAQVFLCFRVLLLRMSPQQMTSMWPGIITEMVQVFLQIEQELSSDCEELSSHMHQTADSPWVSNGLQSHNHPAWLQLYLYACKLLDLAVALPADVLPQFQMYRWAFIGDSAPLSSDENQLSKHEGHTFTPHIMRLAKIINKKKPTYESLPQRCGRPFLTLTALRTVYDLQGFLNGIVNCTTHLTQPLGRPGELPKSRSAPELLQSNDPIPPFDSGEARTTLQFIEGILEMDFLEPRQS